MVHGFLAPHLAARCAASHQLLRSARQYAHRQYTSRIAPARVANCTPMMLLPPSIASPQVEAVSPAAAAGSGKWAAESQAAELTTHRLDADAVLLRTTVFGPGKSGQAAFWAACGARSAINLSCLYPCTSLCVRPLASTPSLKSRLSPLASSSPAAAGALACWHEGPADITVGTCYSPLSKAPIWCSG